MAKHVGRPTTYSAAILKSAEEYLSSCNDEEDLAVDDELEAQPHGGALKRSHKTGVNLPSIEGLSRHLRVSRDTLYEWAKNRKEFSDILEDLRSVQGERLINNGLSGAYNSTITKLMMAKHGYRDEQDITSGGEPITTLTASDKKAITELRDLLKQ